VYKRQSVDRATGDAKPDHVIGSLDDLFGLPELSTVR